MMHTILPLAIFALLPRVSGHSALWHPSMYGFNVTAQTFSYDNRPVAPIKNMNFIEWWFHNHLAHPPNAGDFFELPAGQPATAEIACNKGATSYFASSEGGDIREPNNPNDVCPNSTTEAYHTNGINDLEGCALAIAYKNDVTAVQPEDFTVFSVNHTCVWTRFTDFQVPARMPPCPEGGCICAFFWIHAADSGGEENYMNGFKCNVTGSTSTAPVATSKLARRCGADPANNKMQAAPANCTYGAKTPFYWFNNERNNMFEGTYSPPVYNDLYNFADGAQDDIFVDSYLALPAPGPAAALPVRAGVTVPASVAGGAQSGLSAGTPTGNSTASAAQDGYAYKRDLSDAALLERRRDVEAGFRVNLESRRHRRQVGAALARDGYAYKRDLSDAALLERRRDVEAGFRVNLESRRHRRQVGAAPARDGYAYKRDLSDAALLERRRDVEAGFRVNLESRRHRRQVGAGPLRSRSRRGFW